MPHRFLKQLRCSCKILPRDTRATVSLPRESSRELVQHCHSCKRLFLFLERCPGIDLEESPRTACSAKRIPFCHLLRSLLQDAFGLQPQRKALLNLWLHVLTLLQLFLPLCYLSWRDHCFFHVSRHTTKPPFTQKMKKNKCM